MNSGFKRVTVDEMAGAGMEIMEEIKDLGADGLKKGVKKAGKDIAAELHSTAPVKTGRYAKSWRSAVQKEDADSISVEVYSPSRYMLAHLLEHGHAKRGGGRVRAIPHIEPATDKAVDALEAELKRSVENEL